MHELAVLTHRDSKVISMR